MKKNSLLKFIFGIILLFSFNLNAELIFEENFQKDMHGIWSDDCDSEYQVFIMHWLVKNPGIDLTLKISVLEIQLSFLLYSLI